MKRPPFVALVPVKPPAVGKSRLRGVTDDERAATGDRRSPSTWSPPASATPSVARGVAVTDDAGFAAVLRRARLCASLPDGVAGDLNESLRLGRRSRPAAGGRTWCRSPSAPTCRRCAPPTWPTRWPRGRARRTGRFVADSDGTGTTLYVAADRRLRPPASARRRARRTWPPAPASCAASWPRCGATSTTWRRCSTRGGCGLGPRTSAVVTTVAALGRLSCTWTCRRGRTRAGPASSRGAVRTSWRSSSPWSSWPAPSWPALFFAAVFLAGGLLRRSTSWPPSTSSPSSSWPVDFLAAVDFVGASSSPRAFFAGRLLGRASSSPAPSWRPSTSSRRRLLGRRRSRLLGGRRLLGRRRSRRRLLGSAGRGRRCRDHELGQLLGAGDDVLQVLARR